MIYRISQTLACSRSAAVRIHSFSLFHININSGPAGFITYSHATNKLEAVFRQLFYISCRLSTFLCCLMEIQAVGCYGWSTGANLLQFEPFYVAVEEMQRFNVTVDRITSAKPFPLRGMVCTGTRDPFNELSVPRGQRSACSLRMEQQHVSRPQKISVCIFRLSCKQSV